MCAVMQNIVSVDIGNPFENEYANGFLLFFRQSGGAFKGFFQKRSHG